MKDHWKKGLRMRIVLPLGEMTRLTTCVLHQVSKKSRSVTGLRLRIAYDGRGMSCSSLSVNFRGGSLVTCLAKRCLRYKVST